MGLGVRQTIIFLFGFLHPSHKQRSSAVERGSPRRYSVSTFRRQPSTHEISFHLSVAMWDAPGLLTNDKAIGYLYNERAP